ncbi:uncharacterized protein SRS1_12525 [Sporisorium reilianum f. sp. reilianum]|uniref:F-box domain-containing protein n=1 Tax=Sporisorium reilianum f. sp. reilianum TaxID=72559 RepID=A0A2N8U9Y8_9BASI|nr:uncharacterized protein SRS1_12525 [Sporisorium reilianum f. sp. reilianum]
MNADRGSNSSNSSNNNNSSSSSNAVGIQHLPVEVLHQILVLSRSSSFPVVCRHFRQACQNATYLVKADYVFGRWVDFFVDFIAQHPCRLHKACKKSVNRLVASIEQGRDATCMDVTDCVLALIRSKHLDIVTFAVEMGICTVQVLDRVVSMAMALLPKCVLPHIAGSHTVCDVSLTTPQLPKRLFRRIDQLDTDASEQSRPRKRRRRRNGTDEDTSSHLAAREEHDEPLPGSTRSLAQLKELVWSATKVPPYTWNESDPVSKPMGPVPSAEDFDMILTLLVKYAADASSHQGYPLAMSVHHRAFSLAHLLLLFGAHPRCKDGLAAQIAIRNGSQDILHLLVTGPHFDNFMEDELSVLPWFIPGGMLRLDQTHLRLAIQCRQWDLVDYIWHEQEVSPDMACLRLIERLRS